jgi:hypothetical protein
MFHAMTTSVLGFGKARLFSTALAGAMLAGLPTAAFAHHHGFHVDVIVPVPEVVVSPAPPCDGGAPCLAAPGQVWVPAQYQTVTENVWVDAATTTQMQRVETPAEYERRDVIYYDYFGRAHARREQVEIRPAHCEDRPVQVVIPAHFESRTHQQLVSDGHWETVAPQPAVVVEPAHARIEFPLPF